MRPSDTQRINFLAKRYLRMGRIWPFVILEPRSRAAVRLRREIDAAIAASRKGGKRK